MSKYGNVTIESFRVFLEEFDKRYMAAGEYSIVKSGAPMAGYAATYKLLKGTEAVGEAINVPLDYVIRKAEIKDCGVSGVPEGCEVGDKYVDFTLGPKEGYGSEEHIYLSLKGIGGTVKAGEGLSFEGGAFKIKLDKANGLSVSEEGLSLAAATRSSAGAMTAAQYTKLEGFEVKINEAKTKADTAASIVSGYENRLNTLETAGYIKSTDIGEITEEDLRGLF